MASTIGIKVANGEFYPIMEENSPVKKRLILTTAHDNQKSIQVDLYNSYAKTMADALYVGSLVVENLQARPKGEPNIEMILSSNAAGQITANAVDLDASAPGAPQHLSVSLADVAEEDRVNDEISDFDLELHEPPRGLYERDSPSSRTARKKKSPRSLLLIAGALFLALGGLLYFFFFTGRGIAIRSGLRRPAAAAAPAVPASPAVPAAPARPAQTPAATPAQTPAQPEPAAQPAQPRDQSAAVPEQPLAPPPLISSSQQPPRAAASEARSERTRLPPVASYKVPQTIPRGGAPYTIRWGDTLWDISEAFYRNPWLYPRIARFNAIRDPDFIIAGSAIRIPPRN
jgi:nucleoid-associated protein YgaU